MTKRVFWWLFVIIIVMAAALRFYKLGSIPIGLYWDEAAMLVDAKSVSETGKDIHRNPWYQAIYPSYGDYKLPVYIWLASISVKLFGVSDFALRLPSALAGMWTVIVAGLIAKELGKLSSKNKRFLDKSQLLSMLVVAISPWSILFSRTGFESHLAQSLVATSIWLVLLSRQKPKLFYLSPVIGALATYGYFAVRFVWPFAFVAAAVLAFVNTIRIKPLASVGIKIAISFAIFAILCIPMIKSPNYQASNQFRLGASSILNSYDYPIQTNVYRELAGNGRIDRVFFNQKTLMLREFLKNVSNHLSLNYLFITGDSNLRHGTNAHGLFLLVFLPFLLVGLVFLYQKNPRALFILIVWWLAALIPPSVPTATPHSLRALNALVPIATIIGFGLAYVIPKLSKFLKVVLVVVTLACAVEFATYYFTQYPYESGVYWQGGYKEVALKILELQKEKNIHEVYVKPFDERFYLWLMAYGPYHGKDFQSWQTIHYMVEQIDGIHLPHGWPELKLGKDPVLVVTKNHEQTGIPAAWVKETVELTPEYVPDTFEFMVVQKD